MRSLPELSGGGVWTAELRHRLLSALRPQQQAEQKLRSPVARGPYHAVSLQLHGIKFYSITNRHNESGEIVRGERNLRKGCTAE